MADRTRIIAKSAALEERTHGLRFDLPELGEHVSGFVVRFDHQVYAYVNQCAHVPIELDWNEGDFFDLGKDYLLCATHGAHYQPQTGHCVMGPCKGKRLQKLKVSEENGNILLDIDSIRLDSSRPD